MIIIRQMDAVAFGFFKTMFWRKNGNDKFFSALKGAQTGVNRMVLTQLLHFFNMA